METTDAGTSVGVADPYDHVDRCDHLTNDGRCRLAIERSDQDPAFARERRADEYRCPVAGAPDQPGLTGPWEWQMCPHFRSRATDRECVRCELGEVRMAHETTRPLLEEHHLSYARDDETSHEITVFLCRWCHAKVHDSWAGLADDVTPDPEAIAAREARRAREQAEFEFSSAANRRDTE